jgi:hypothetical protein
MLHVYFIISTMLMCNEALKNLFAAPAFPGGGGLGWRVGGGGVGGDGVFLNHCLYKEELWPKSPGWKSVKHFFFTIHAWVMLTWELCVLPLLSASMLMYNVALKKLICSSCLSRGGVGLLLNHCLYKQEPWPRSVAC